jgi:hypothetical protein
LYISTTLSVNNTSVLNSAACRVLQFLFLLETFLPFLLLQLQAGTMAAEDEDVPIAGAFQYFVGMLPQTGKYASLLQQRLAEAQGQEDNSSESDDEESGSDSEKSGEHDNGSGELEASEADDVDTDESEADIDEAGSAGDNAEDESNSAEQQPDVFQQLFWGAGMEGEDDPEEQELVQQLEKACQLESRPLLLDSEQLGLADTPEGHQTPFVQISAHLPTLPANKLPTFLNTSIDVDGAASARKRRRAGSSTSRLSSAVTCVDLCDAYRVGTKSAKEFALYSADRRLALKRAGEEVSEAAIAGFDERLAVSAGPEAREGRTAAMQAAVAAASGKSAHPLQPSTVTSALLSPLQRLVLDNALDYRDMVLPVEAPRNMSQLRTALALHVASHLQRARNRVIKHDSQLRSAAAARRVKRLATAVDSVKPAAGGASQGGEGGHLVAAEAANAAANGASATGVGAADGVEEEELDPEALRDQGVARCRVVVLLPFKHMALQFVRCLLTLLRPGRTVHHMKRFMEEFGDEEAKRGEAAHVMNTTGEEDWTQDDFTSEAVAGRSSSDKKARTGKKKPPPKRPTEHNQQFAGDVDGELLAAWACELLRSHSPAFNFHRLLPCGALSCQEQHPSILQLLCLRHHHRIAHGLAPDDRRRW